MSVSASSEPPRAYFIDVLKKDAYQFEDFPASIRADREIALLALTKSSFNFEYCSDQLRADREFYLAAVAASTQAGDENHIFEYAAPALRGDRELALAACKSNGWNLEYCPAELKRDADLCLAACKQTGHALEYVPAEVLLSHPEIAVPALRSEPSMMEHVPNSLFRNTAFMSHSDIIDASLAADGQCLEGLPEEFKTRERVLAAVRSSEYALEFALSLKGHDT